MPTNPSASPVVATTSTAPAASPDRLYDTRGAAAYLTAKLGVRRAANTLSKLRCVGGGPAFVRIGGRGIAYREADLDRWADGLVAGPFESTTQAERR